MAKTKVLIVDDEDTWLNDACETTAFCEHEPVRASSLQEAFMILDENPEIKAIITDIGLGSHDGKWDIGLDILKKISEREVRISCYAHSAVDDVPAGVYTDSPINLMSYVDEHYGNFAEFHLKRKMIPNLPNFLRKI